MWSIAVQSLLAFKASLLSLFSNLPVITLLLIGQIGVGVIVEGFLEEWFGEKTVRASLAFLGGILGLVLLCLIFAWFKIQPSTSFLLPWALAGAGAVVWRRNSLKKLWTIELLWLALFLGFIFCLRLVFLQGLLVPPYADSIQHAAILRDMLSPDNPPTAFYRLGTDLSRYYHFGFHALAAWLSGVGGHDPLQTILVLGQYFQMLAVLGLYPLAATVLNDRLVAWLVMICGGLFLPLPAYASNWGKYPAIASLTGITFIFSLLYIYMLSARDGQALPRRFYSLAGFSVLAAVLLHNRALIIGCTALLLAWFIHLGAAHRRDWHLAARAEGWLTVKIASALVIPILAAVLVMLLDLPLHPLWGILLAAVILMSFWADFALTLFFALFLITIALFALLPEKLGLNYFLIDRPYAAIFLYIPFSFMMGLAVDWLFRIGNRSSWRRMGFGLVLFAGVLSAVFLQNQRPDPCCVFINDDDLFSFEWIRQNIPANALIGVAATGHPGDYLPSDGGGWIESMTGIPTRKLDSSTDFSLETDMLCRSGLKYVYVDASDNSFDASTLAASGAKHLMGLGSVSFYQLNCG